MHLISLCQRDIDYLLRVYKNPTHLPTAFYYINIIAFRCSWYPSNTRSIVEMSNSLLEDGTCWKHTNGKYMVKKFKTPNFSKYNRKLYSKIFLWNQCVNQNSFLIEIFLIYILWLSYNFWISNFSTFLIPLSKWPNKTPAGIYLLRVNNKNTITRCEICSKLTWNKFNTLP